MKQRITERFIDYVKIDTTSDPESTTVPSTARQFNLARRVKADLEELGMTDIVLDDNCYLTATLPSNCSAAIETVGFVAHFDTSNAVSGSDVKPIIHKNYDGADVALSEQVRLQVTDYPELAKLAGYDLITSDGSTLLGSDDKAGIAEIIEMLAILKENPSYKHGTIKVLFTPDEEIGRGANHVNLDNFTVDFAYTVDGGAIGELEYENFNAASLQVKTTGVSIHPGSAKDKMINALQLAIDYHNRLPAEDVPEKTEGYQGFFHLVQLCGDVTSATASYIIRDHDKAQFNAKKQLAEKIAQDIQSHYDQPVIEIDLKDSYYNMKEKIEPVIHIVNYVETAMRRLDITPVIKPIRGGTDGSRLSFMGVPTPNICTGGANFHGRFEYNSVQNLETTAAILVELVKIIAE